MVIIVQLFIFCISFYVFTSTIKGFPWYEPLTMGAYFAVMFLIPIQGFITLILLGMYKKTLIPKNIQITSIVSTGILILAFLIPQFNEDAFYLFAKVCSVILILLLIFLLFSIIKWLIMKKQK